MKKFLRSRWGITIVIIIGLALIIVAQNINALRPAENIITTTLKPVQSFFSLTAERVKGLFSYFQSVDDLREQNIDLKKKNEKLTVENLKVKNQIDDSELIKEQLDFITEYSFESVASKIIGRSSAENLQVVIINKGSKSDIKTGAPVIAGEGIMVGKVIEVNTNISKILLLSDNHSEIGAIVQNDSKSPGIISGQHGISLLMDLIPQDEQINTGEIVTTSGLEQNIPPGLAIGEIKSIQKIEGELFQQAIVEPLTDLEKINIVTVILPSND